MRNKKPIILGIAFITAMISVGIFIRSKNARENGEVVKEIQPYRGTIETSFSTTGSILPKNRLEIRPAVSGRIERILVQEGQMVNAGQTIAWMSSSERAALLDAAHGQGEETKKYWEEAYKAIPIVAPINGEVIVAKMQSGQSVSTGDAVIVLSDQLIARAQVDETDIGKIIPGQQAQIVLEAYPESKISAAVEHVYHESKTVNNVTVYEVDLLPEKMPDQVRSGMNATIYFIDKQKKDALLIPTEAILRDKDTSFVFVLKQGSSEPVKYAVTTGISDDRSTEILSGINASDTIIMKARKYALPKNTVGSNPFMPNRRQRK